MRLNRQYRSPRRGGFTIVELLVAAAVSIVLMIILTEAFKRGIDMFRTLRAQGQLQERLRLASIGMRDDLASFHFDNPKNGSSNVNQHYLSDIDLRNDINNRDTNQPPELGFFRIVQFSPDWLGPTPNNNNGNNPGQEPCVFEGTDGDGMLFTRATTHALHFTVLRREQSPSVIAKNPVDPSYLFRTLEAPMVMNTPLGPKQWPYDYIDPPDFREPETFSSRWAEVAYFLSPSGRTANGTQLFNLYRRSKSLVPDPDPSGPTSIPPGDVQYTGNRDISVRQQYFDAPVPNTLVPLYNRPSVGDGMSTRPGITYPCNRFAMQPAARFPVTDAHTNEPKCAGLMGDPNNGYLSHAGYNPAAPFVPYPRLADEIAANAPDRIKIGDDIILSDVISFEIKVRWDSPPRQIINPLPVGPPLIDNPYYVTPPRLLYNVPNLAGPATVNSDYPFDYLPLSQLNRVLSTPSAVPGFPATLPPMRVFDTWAGSDRVKDGLGNPVDMYARPRQGSNHPLPPFGLTPAWKDAGPAATGQTGARIPLRIRVRAVMVRLRIWDSKAEQTRQITIIMDL